ncbi:MAG: hypothetical protein FJ288_05670 [Planctomycetes bacterium]|nr:hypothetical protein [Planctomycetota bacterium]
MTFVGREDFASAFYFPDAGAGEADVEFSIEGAEAVLISAVTAHAHADAIVREFDRGLVLANPSARPYEFDVAALAPGGKFRRIQGSALQDPKTNDGSAVAGKVTLGPKDALFLVRDGP